MPRGARAGAARQPDVAEAAAALGQKVAEIAGAVGVHGGGALLVQGAAWWSTRSPPGPTTRVTGRSRAPSPPSSRTTCGPCWTCPSARPPPNTPEVGQRQHLRRRRRRGPGPPARRRGLSAEGAHVHLYGKARPARAQTGSRDRLRRRRRPRAGPRLVGRHGPRHAACPKASSSPGGALPVTPDGRARVVAVVMGSSSDLPVMRGAVEMLERFGVAHEVRVVSAHRTPDDMIAFGQEAAGTGAPGPDRRRRRRRPPARDAGLGDHPAGDRRPGRAVTARRARQPPLHRADAQGRAGGHDGGERRPQRRPAGRAHPGGR